jgi:ribosomal protein S18 acetylase RimI-like enzyme
MVTNTKLSVRHATSDDRTSLANILHFEPYVHRHLDWRPPLDWLGYEPYVVLEREGRIIAALACPPDPPGIAWIRVFACNSRFPARDAWDLLWKEAARYLKRIKVDAVAAIPLQQWFRSLMLEKQFKLEHSVVSLMWQEQELDDLAVNGSVDIRQMKKTDLEQVQEVDNQAFGPIWRNSLESLRLAYEQAVYATVVDGAEGLLGYQISTPSPLGAHLARLAVPPEAQRQGIGFALVRDVQRRLRQANSFRLTVNTQDVNKTSLSLYHKAGFVETGETFPVYLYEL